MIDATPAQPAQGQTAAPRKPRPVPVRFTDWASI